MNWEAIGAIGEIAGAIGVIVTLAYLSVQLRHNTKASRLSAIQAASENSSRFSELLASDAELSELVWRGLRAPDSLDPAEKRRFIAAINVFMRREAVAFYLHREGLMPEELWAARLGGLTGTLNQPGTLLYLDLAGHTLPSDFRELLVRVTAEPSTLNETAKSILGISDDDRHET